MFKKKTKIPNLSGAMSLDPSMMDAGSQAMRPPKVKTKKPMPRVPQAKPRMRLRPNIRGLGSVNF